MGFTVKWLVPPYGIFVAGLIVAKLANSPAAFAPFFIVALVWGHYGHKAVRNYWNGRMRARGAYDGWQQAKRKR